MLFCVAVRSGSEDGTDFIPINLGSDTNVKIHSKSGFDALEACSEFTIFFILEVFLFVSFMLYLFMLVAYKLFLQPEILSFTEIGVPKNP